MKIYLTKWTSWQEFFGSVYVFNEITKLVYIFCDSAEVFWNAMISDNDVDRMTSTLCDYYESDSRDQIHEDLLMFIEELESFGLVQKEEVMGNGEL